MHFERSLRRSIYPPWRDQYIDYSKLKHLLRDSGSDAGSPLENEQEWTDADEDAFVDELINNQLDKVAHFHAEEAQRLRDRVDKCEERLTPIVAAEREREGEQAHNDPQSSGKPPSAGRITLQEIRQDLDGITKEMNELEKYARINYTGFLKAAKKHDRKRGGAYRVRPFLQVRLSELPFNKEDYQPIMYRLQSMYSFVRQMIEGRDKKLSFSESQLSEDGFTTYKFWIHPDNMLEVRSNIVQRLPGLVYNPQSSKIVEGYAKDPTITSIYFDNPSFSLYNAKLIHDQSASSLRLRWFGELTDKPEIFVEKKTVHPDETTTEERLTTKAKYIEPFVFDGYRMDKSVRKASDRYGPNSEQVRKLQQEVDTIEDFIKEHELQPVLRANYSRAAFQIPGDNRVRVTLDSNLALIREDALDDQRPCREPNEWHRRDIDERGIEWPFDQIRSGEIVRFPYGVLEIRIRGNKQYEWIQELMDSHLVKAAPRFSKFAHGIGTLFDDYVNQFPFWLPEVDTDIRKDPHQAFEEEQRRKQQIAADDFAVGSYLKAVSPSFKPHRMSPVGSPMSKPRSDTSLRRANADDTRTDPRTRKTRLESIVPDDDEAEEQKRPTPEIRDSRGRLSGFISKYARFRRSKGIELPEGVEKPAYWIKDEGPVKVEAKVWLANQRTFIKWQHVGVLLSTFSLGLYNAAGEDNTTARNLGIIYTLIGIFTALWGYGMYIRRSRLIQQRSGKDFDNVIGPVIVCLALVVALVLNFSIKVTSFLPSHPGGQKVVLQLAGQDATSEYDPVHPPGTLESSLPPTALLGDIDPSTLPAAEQPNQTSSSSSDQPQTGPPPLDTLLNLNDIEQAATPLLSRKAWAYYYSASDDLHTKHHNNSIYRQILLRPRIFVDVVRCSLQTSFLGHALSSPIYVAPAAMARLAHPDGERGIARACAKHGSCYIVSNNASMTPEQIVEGASPEQVMGWQLYVNTERRKSEDMLARIAKLPQYKFICLTLDAPVPGKREDDERAKNIGANLPVKSAVQSAANVEPRSADTGDKKSQEEKGKKSEEAGGIGKALFAGTAADLTWRDTLPWLCRHTDLPVILKGVQTYEDAYLAYLYSKRYPQLEGVVLSNHGGRAMDTASPPLLVLLEIRQHCPIVLRHLEVYLDGGIKRGTDVVKALALGARGVGVGRAALFGLGVGGQEGVERMLEILREETETAMRLLGVQQVSELGARHLNVATVEGMTWRGRSGLEELERGVEMEEAAGRAKL
ncbi:MAG: hypothetical protein Q9159_002075 [Coniocarpon cinnabarinum]